MGPTPIEIAQRFVGHPDCENVLRTTFVVDEVPGVYVSGQYIHGTINPVFQLDYTSRAASAESWANRYGEGAGIPAEQDMSVLPAISFKPSKRYARKGIGVEERVWMPQDKSITALGINVWEWTQGQQDSDYRMMVDLQERVIAPLDLGFPIGTAPEVWKAAIAASSTPWHPPVWPPQSSNAPVTAPTTATSPAIAPSANQPPQAPPAQLLPQPPAAAPLSLADLQSLIAQSVAQAIGQAVPALIQAEVGRLVPTSVPTPVSPAGGPASPDSGSSGSSSTATAALKAQLATANQTLTSINDALRGLAIAPVGGGKPMVALRKIAAIMQSVK
jgi:hypothetical protein